MKSKHIIPLAALIILSAFGIQSGAAQSTGGVSKTIPQTRKPVNDSETKPSVGVILGMADTTEGDRNSALGYGVNVAFQPLIPWSAGVELSHYTSGSDNPGEHDLNRTKLLATGAFNFGGMTPIIRHSYIALSIGPVFDEVDNRWDTELGVAPGLGFDIPIAQNEMQQTSYTLGANANYLFVTGPQADTFALNGVLKYWF